MPHEGVPHPGLTDAEADALDAAQGGGGADEDSAIGRIVTDESGNRGRLGVATSGQFAGQLFLSDPETGAVLGFFPKGGGLRFITDTDEQIEVNAQGLILGSRPLTQSERNALGRGFGTTTGGGGAGGLTFEQRQQLAEEDRTAAAEQSALNREMNLRLQRLSDANALTGRLIDAQTEARNLIVETIGRDPFRGAVLAQGGFAPAVTPLSAFREEVQTVADRPVERATGEESLEELQGLTERQQGLLDRPVEPPIALRGLKHGGIIDMERDGDTFRVKPRGGPAFDAPAGSGVLVGEDGKEVVRRNLNGQIEIIPIVASAQEGLTIGGDEGPGGLLGATGQGTARGAVQGLIPLFEAAGFSGELPIATRNAPGFGGFFQAPSIGTGIGFPTQAPGRTADIFGRLGTPPRLIFIPEFNSLFTVDPSGEAQVLGDAQRAQELGFDLTTAQTVSQEQAKQMGIFGNVEAPFEQQAGMFQPRTGRFGAREPIFMPFDKSGTKGIFLPDPAQLAAVWDKQDSFTKSLAISAYGLANISEQELLDRMRFFRPTGTGSAARTALLR